LSREVWAVVSDLHCGSTLGLCPSYGIRLDDGGAYHPSPAQVVLWNCWIEYWQTVASRLQEGDRLILLVNGDAVDGDHHHTPQIVSKNLATTQSMIAQKALLPALTLEPSAIVFVRGTEAHVGNGAEFEEKLARDLGAVENAETGARSHWHFQAESNGVLLDFAHHGRLGQRPWTKTTGPSTLAAQIALAAAQQGVRAPDLVVRSHYHQGADSFDNFAVRVIQTRGWQLSTAFVHRVAAGSIPQIGGLIVTTEGGKYAVEKVNFAWKREAPWKLSA
jgi:hypothetical protein